MSGYCRNVAVYCRSATRRQAQSDTLAPQRTRCGEYALAKGYLVARVFEDKGSVSCADHPGMKALLAYIGTRRAEGVVLFVDDRQRIARVLAAYDTKRAAIAMVGGTIEDPSVMPECGNPQATLARIADDERLSRHLAQKELGA